MQESRVERQTRAYDVALLFEMQGGTEAILALLQDRAKLSERYQIPAPETRADRVGRAIAERSRVRDR